MNSYSYFIDPLEALEKARNDADVITLKYISTNRGYFFCGSEANHKELLKKSGADKATSAGFIWILLGEEIKIVEEWSQSLMIGPDFGADSKAFEEIFKVKVIIPEWICI